jgi:hypothetical protein
MSCTRLKIHPLTKRDFSLTKKIESVELNRSLTASKVFPVGAASGTQAQSPSRENDEGGQARVYSKALVEENKKKR